MTRKLLYGFLAVIATGIAIGIVLSNENALVIHPKGMIARKELELIGTNILLMLTIIVPAYFLLFWVVWNYCIKKKKDQFDPSYSLSPFGKLLMWILPSIVVAVMSFVTWEATHDLNPYKPIDSEEKPLTIQVVALDWKWLFIYPEQGIATLNDFHIPQKTPIHLKLTADGAPMSSFWIPQLSGQIYSMTGMTTQLHLIADGPGKYVGRAVEINGEGYADMTFSAASTSRKEFDEWVEKVKQSSLHLTEDHYNELVKPSINKSVVLFSVVDSDLFHKIIHKYMYPAKKVL